MIRYVLPRFRNGLDKEQLIELVQKRPVLWDKNCDVYKDKQLRAQAWREICAVLNEDYEKLDEKDSLEYMRAITRIWQHTRDSWMRSLQAQKKGISTRPYTYHKNLLFLNSVQINAEAKVREQLQQAETAEAIKSITSEIDIPIKEEINIIEVDCDTGSGEDEEYVAASYSSTNDEESQDVKKRRIEEEEEVVGVKKEFVDVQESNGRTDVIDERIVSYMNNRMANSVLISEDRHMAFFKSIQPSLALFNDDQTLEFQSGVIALIQNIKRKSFQ